MKETIVSNVWDAIEDDPAVAENMRMRSTMMMALKEAIERRELTQAQAAALFGVSQPRVSDLMRGKIEVFGLDSLVTMLAAVGLRVDVTMSEAG